MVAVKIAAVLLAVNAVIGVVGVLASGSRSSAGVKRPAWLPPLWLRAAVPLVVASGLWFAQSWAWWTAVVISFAMLSWTALSSAILGVGGFFREHATSRAVYIGSLAATWVGVLVALLVSV